MPSSILSDICRIAREAGSIVRSHFEHLDRSEIHKKNVTDMVTDADRETEAFIRQELAKAYPDIPFLGEESGGKLTCTGPCFVVDPIDGTTSFVHGHPYHSVSIAYQEDGLSQAGAVYLPAFQQLYTAVRGQGAFKNGKAIHVTKTENLIDALGATGFGCVRSNIKPDNVPVLADFIYKLRGFRTCGSAAIDLCYVAEGHYDAYWEFYLKPWDFAAGQLIVEEAGGKVTGFDSNPPDPKIGRLLATNGPLHPKMLEVIQKYL